MISSKKYVDETLRKYQLKANKALGQNFLVEENVVNGITKHIDDSLAFLEIGPGLGALTEKLVQTNKNVYAFEIDKNMVAILKDTFKDTNNFFLYNMDILKVDLVEFLKDKENKITIISNLPYYITSQILTKVLTLPDKICRVIVMMQKEVGQKLLQGKDGSFLNYLIQYKYDINLVTHVSKNSFLPRPDIDSVVLQFKRKEVEYQIANEEQFYSFLKSILLSKRKTITNNLQNFFSNKQDILSFLEKMNINNQYRVEQLTFKEIVSIYQNIFQK